MPALPPPALPDFQQLFEKGPEACLVILPDANYTVVAVSDAYLHATRLTRDGILGRPLFDMFPGATADPRAMGAFRLRASLKRVLATRVPDALAVQRYDLPRPEAEGGGFEERYWNLLTTPMLSADGDVSHLLHQVEDVTRFMREQAGGAGEQEHTACLQLRNEEMAAELLRQSQELREAVEARDESLVLVSQAREQAERQREWLQTIFHHAPIGIAIFRGPRHVIELANPLLCRLWNRRPEQVLGRPVFEVFPETVGQGFEELLNAVLATGETYVGREMPIRLARLENGGEEEIYLDFVYEPLRDARGEVGAVIAVASDVTERVRARQRSEALAADALRSTQERLHLASEALGLGTWDVDLVTGGVVWDERARALFGVSVDAPVDYFLFLSRVHPEERERVARLIAESLTPGGTGVISVDFRVLAHEGAEERWVYSRCRTWNDASGRPVRFLGTALDITDRKRAGEELARNAAILQAILQSIPDALYVGDAQGITQANAAALDMLGFQSLEDLNHSVATLGERLRNHSVADGHRLTPEEEPFMQAVRGRATIQEVLSHHLLTGRDVVVRCAAAPVRIGEEIVGAVAINTDITERKRLETEQLRTAEFRERLLGIVSHDLRNPLNAILLSANALMRSDTIVQHHLKMVRRIETSAERMGRMISDLLDFTRGRLDGGIPISPRPTHLRALCQHVLEELEAGSPRRELRLSTRGDRFQGNWDADRLAQLLGNLGKNALDYSPEDTPVDFTVRDEGDRVCVEVHNAGAPIPAALLPRIFEPFRRATGQDHPSSGLGLGLFIVQEIARAHGGRVTVRSTEVEGTTFSVCLPRSAPTR